MLRTIFWIAVAMLAAAAVVLAVWTVRTIIIPALEGAGVAERARRRLEGWAAMKEGGSNSA